MVDVKWPTVDELNKINMGPVVERVPNYEQEYIGYINEKAGQEHYRLLSWISNYFKDTQIVEVGVYKGCSGLALSVNKSNNVIGFDLHNFITCSMPENYKLIVEDCRNYPDILIKAGLIFYDTAHDGVVEREFMEFIKNIKYKGIVLFDDIKLNDPMISFWNELTYNYPSLDLSKLGHCTGTGVIWV